MDKPVYEYDEIAPLAIELGSSVWLHKKGLSAVTWSLTSSIVSYDETTGIIETLNSVYVPAA